MSDAPVPLCPVKAAHERLSACVREEGHDGEHIYCRRSRGCRGGRNAGAIWFYNDAGEAVMHADVTSVSSFTRQDAAVLYAFADMKRSDRAG